MVQQKDIDRAIRLRNAIAQAVKTVEAVTDSAIDVFDDVMVKVEEVFDGARRFIDGMDEEIARQQKKAGTSDKSDKTNTNPGGTDTEITREQKITRIKNYLEYMGGPTNSVWHTDPGGINDRTVDTFFEHVLRRGF